MPSTTVTDLEKFRSIAQSIVSSYEYKVKTVTSLMREVEQKIIQTYEFQNNAIKRIRDTLAKSRSLRLRDFDGLMKPIVDLQNHRKEQINMLLEGFCREEEENILELKDILVGKNGSSMEDFYTLKGKILSRPKAREAELSELLKSFHQDQAELDVVLRRLLAKGARVQLKDLKKAVRAFQANHYGDAVVVDDILKEFSQIKEDIDHQWKAVVNAVGLKKFATRTADEI